MTPYRKHLEQKVQEETGGELGDSTDLGKFTWKDYLYIVPPVLLIVYLIIRSLF